MFHLIESIRFLDGIPQLLSYHQERLSQSYKECFRKECPYSLSEIISHEKNISLNIVKCRFLYTEKAFQISFHPYVYKEIQTVKLIHHNSIDYHLKYNNRDLLNSLYAKRGEADDIIICKNELLTDSCFANIVLFDGKTWFTPAGPLLKGCMRQSLLDEGIIQKKDIPLPQIKFYLGEIQFY